MKANTDEEILQQMLRGVGELQVHTLLHNCLVSRYMVYVGDVVLQDERYLRSIPRFGDKCWERLQNSLQQRGLCVGMPLSDAVRTSFENATRFYRKGRDWHHLITTEEMDLLGLYRSLEGGTARKVIRDLTLDILLREVESGTQPILMKKIDDLPFSVRVRNVLDNGNIHYVGQLAAKPVKELLKYRNMRDHDIEEIESVLHVLGLHLGMLVRKDTLERMWEKQEEERG